MIFKQRPNHSGGFTIVELLIATAVFSIVLVVVTTGAISFTKQYYKGITTNTTQNVTRAAINEVSQAIQFGSGTVSSIPSPLGQGGFCINDKPYYFALGYQLGGNNSTDRANDILVTSDDSCARAAPNIIANGTNGLNNPRELLGKNMRLAAFNVICAPGSSQCQVTMRVAYGDYDLLCVPNAGACTPAASAPSPSAYASDKLRCVATAGSQFCSVIQLSASVGERLQ